MSNNFSLVGKFPLCCLCWWWSDPFVLHCNCETWSCQSSAVQLTQKEIFFICLIQSLGKNGGEDLDISKMVLFCKENSPSCPFKTDDKIAGSFAGGAARPWLNLPAPPAILFDTPVTGMDGHAYWLKNMINISRVKDQPSPQKFNPLLPNLQNWVKKLIKLNWILSPVQQSIKN